jgi:hypothetical protein
MCRCPSIANSQPLQAVTDPAQEPFINEWSRTLRAISWSTLSDRKARLSALVQGHRGPSQPTPR